MTDKILGYAIDDRTAIDFPYDMEVDLHNAIHSYLHKGGRLLEEHKAKAFDYLNKILYTEMNIHELMDFIDNLNEEEGSMIVWAGGLTTEEEDYIIVALQKPSRMTIELYSYKMSYDGTTLPIYKEDEPETEVDMWSRLCEE